ncbi:hypothetical protein [Prochlorococcus marinus]|nr:hypothetical protein [Prochlorococcus marinus]
MALLAQQGVLQANTQRTNASNKARKNPVKQNLTGNIFLPINRLAN